MRLRSAQNANGVYILLWSTQTVRDVYISEV